MKTVIEDRAVRSRFSWKHPGMAPFAVYCAVSLFVILYIPYFFPVRPSTSDSYIFGYNNTVGVILLLLLATVGAIWTRGLNFNFSPTTTSPKVQLKYLWLSLAVELSACIGMYVCVGRYGAFSESEYQISRLWLLSLGKRPYVDFECNRGPALLYLPKWLSGIFHLTIPQGYFLFWTLSSLAGMLLLFAIVNLIDFPSKHKTSIFLLFSGCALLTVPNMGINYTLVRYLCPLFFILIVYNVDVGGPQPRAKIHAGILSVVFTGILMLISPEVTIAHALGCVVLLYSWRTSQARPTQICVYLATLAGLAILFACGIRLHIFDDIFTDGRGASSFPITFAPATLTFFFAVFVCSCYIVRRVSRRDIRDNTLALLALSTPMTAAALGRCDPGHILLNGIGFFIAVFFYASASSSMWKMYCTIFVICVLLVNTFLTLVMWGVATTSSLPAFPEDGNIYSLYPQTFHPTGDGILEAPFGYRPDAKGFYFTSQIDYSFYVEVMNANSPAAFDRQISELASHPQRSLLLRKKILGICDVDERQRRTYVGVLSFFPYTARAKHLESVRQPLCAYIVDHYRLAEPGNAQNFNFELWLPKS